MQKNSDTDFVVIAVLTELSKAFDCILHDLLANVDYCPLVWILSSASSLKKIENLQKGALRFYVMTMKYHTKTLTLFAKNQDQIDSPVQTVHFSSDDVRMDLGVSKWEC